MLVVGGSGGSEHAAHTGSGTWSAFLQAAGRWALMSFAMMMPVALPAIRHVSLNSLRVRRGRAVALYVGSYLLVWLLVGVAAAVVVVAATAGGVTVRQLLVLTLATAALWQLTRAKRRAILACRRTVPLPPMGRPADVACVTFAFVQGMRCATSCWPLMLLMAVAPHTLTLMLAATLIVVAEERLSIRHRLIRPLAAVFAVATIAAMLVE
jgi:predicted metal-binding membrane protein